MTERAINIGIVVGEVSGDALGAKLVRTLRAALEGREIAFCGVSGPLMQAEGVPSLFPLEDIAVMGIVPVIKRLPSLLKRISETADALIAFKPDILLIIDSPDFTHRVAKRVRKAMPDLPVVDYVSPSVWAWRPGRAKKMRAIIDHVLAILPFEPEAHRRLGGPECTYVGHPLIERPDLFRLSEEDQARRAKEPPRVLVLPGSRRSEIQRLMPVFGEVVKRVAERYEGSIEFVLPAVQHVRPMIEEALADWPIKPRLVVGEEEKYRAFRQARAALAASGTVTLELAMAHVPMVVAYRVGAIEGQIRHFIHAPSIVLANLVMGENIVPEFIQKECEPERLTAHLLPLLSDSPERQSQMNSFEKLDAKMAGAGQNPSAKAAAIIKGMIKKV
jgi:lipid-A-disaccharide synthase